MKRPLAYSALPLVLVTLLLGVKWRAEHPTATKEDLAIRALMLKSWRATASHDLSSFHSATVLLSKAEFAALVSDFFLSPIQSVGLPTPSSNQVVHFSFAYPQTKSKREMSKISIEINARTYWGWINVHRKRTSEGYKLHPVSVKRWTELLLANTRIGPKLRAQLEP